MSKYRVSLCFSQYVETEVESNNPDEALRLARRNHESIIGDWDSDPDSLQPWREGDMVELIEKGE